LPLIPQAAGAYAYAEASASFCREHMLHEKTMRQQLQLRQQLSTVVNRHVAQDAQEKKKERQLERRKQKKMLQQKKKYSKTQAAVAEVQDDDDSDGEDEILELEVTPQLPPPTQEQREILLQVLAAGFITQVARKLPPLDIAFEPQNEDGSMGASSASVSGSGVSKDGKGFKGGGGGGGSRLQRLCAYESCDPRLKEPLYIHPRSGLFRADPTALPEYIIFQSMSRGSYGSRLLFVRGVSVVEPEWLRTAAAGTPLCVMGPPELLMPPVYDPQVDKVLGWSTPTFGPRQWQLPLVKVPLAQTLDFETNTTGVTTKSASADMKASELEYRWFARFLLEGKVVPVLAQLTEQLKINPNWITGNHLDKRIMLLISALQTKQVSSRAQLRRVWAEGGADFLFREVRSCVRDAQHHVLEHIWPVAVKQA
jgi:ATP-dependent RNA helicase DHX37/DHR1